VKILLHLLFVCSALDVSAAENKASDFIFPLGPQSERDIKLNSKPPIRGKLLLYSPARIHIEKTNGTIILVRPSELDKSELKRFPESAQFLFAESPQSPVAEDSTPKLRAIVEDLEAEKQLNLRELTQLRAENTALKQTNARFESHFTRSPERRPSLPVAKSPANSPSTASQWRQLAKYSGTGQQETIPFTITARQWRLRWTCANQKDGPGFLSVAARGPGDILLVNTIHPGTDVCYLRDRGRFNLTIASEGMAWTLIVEEAVP
jgi:hypothetical protein